MNLSLQEAAGATGARLLQAGGPEAISRVSTDTRTISPGDCFVALRGERLDGHEYIDEAVDAGAAALIVEREFPQHRGVHQLIVADTLHALGELARHWRKRNIHVPAVVLTGSSGKTTTKEMAARVVGGSRRVLATHGNLNNLIGLPQMMFQLGEEHEATILELGMNTPGELQRLVEIAQPQCVAVTNITNAHIGKLGSEENLYQAKAESLRYSGDDVIVVLNAEDRLSQRVRAEHARGRRVISFGMTGGAEVRARQLEPLEPFGYAFELQVGQAAERVELRMFGRHNVSNALAAAAIGRFFDIPLEEIAARLSSFEPMGNRSEVEKINGWLVVKDYYNASPAAVEQALHSLRDFRVPGRYFAVLADMLELGDMEERYHREVGHLASTAGLQKLFTLGERGKWISDAAAAGGTRTGHFADVDAAAESIRGELRPGDLLLIKGSRLMKLETLYELLKG
jgi:UDP-N-acetylmuramoyl-tripeptide--D-alanyl-D-alanine ligase